MRGEVCLLSSYVPTAPSFPSLLCVACSEGTNMQSLLQMYWELTRPIQSVFHVASIGRAPVKSHELFSWC